MGHSTSDVAGLRKSSAKKTLALASRSFSLKDPRKMGKICGTEQILYYALVQGIRFRDWGLKDS